MNSADLSIESINEQELIELIEKRKVDLAILKSKNIATIENLNFLFLVDRITLAEFASYRGLDKSTVYRHVMKNYGPTMLQVREVKDDYKITVRPRDLFDNIYDYEDFLKWRTEGNRRKKTISIKDTMDITGLTRSQILTLIKKDKLVAIKRKNAPYEILNSSLSLFLIDHLLETKKRMDKAVEYLNRNGNTVCMKLYIKDMSI